MLLIVTGLILLATEFKGSPVKKGGFLLNKQSFINLCF